MQDVFRAMHLNIDVVQLYLKPLLIGELAQGEPNQEIKKNVSKSEDSIIIERRRRQGGRTGEKRDISDRKYTPVKGVVHNKTKTQM